MYYRQYQWHRLRWMRLFSRQATWLLPGLYIKRWIGLSIFGFLFLMVGVAMILNLHPVAATFDVFRSIAPHLPPPMSGPLLIGGGLLLMAVGSRRTVHTVYHAIDPDHRQGQLLETLYRRHKLDRGPRIVAIGGGTGLSTLLRGIKRYTNNITAIVAVGDDGGSSGRLRKEQGIIPPGDIRNCIAALADEEQLITELFQYRFASGEGLGGHSFGNLFLTAMCQITGDMFTAIKESAKVLNIRGKVLPASIDSISLVAEMENGQVIRGESQIPEVGCRIRRLRCEPDQPAVLPEVLVAIQHADLILLGPGSLYTSVLPNLIIELIARALADSKAPKAYIANIMTQPGETDGFSVGDHVQAILDHTASVQGRVVDVVFANSWLPPALIERYQSKRYQPVTLDIARCEQLGVKVLERLLVDEHNTTSVRHNEKRLARAIIHWYKRHYN